jgi:hypothetical protein
MVPSLFLVTIVKQIAGAIAVAARVRGCRGGGVRGLFFGRVWLFVCNANTVTVWCAVVVIYGLSGASDKKTALI